MISTTLQALEIVFATVIQTHNFKEIERDDPGFMDNGYIIYESDGLFIRLISDRGVPTVEIGGLNVQPEWFDLALLRNYIDNLDVLAFSSPEELSVFVNDNFLNLHDMFTNKIDSTIQLIQNIQKERVVRMFPKNYSHP